MTFARSYSASQRLSCSLLLSGIALLAGCGSHRTSMPANAYVGERAPAAWPTPRIARPDAPAEIQAMRFSSLDVKLGNDWSGQFIASSNTASIEVTTNLFSFSVPRPRIGDFRFRFHLLDVPAFFVRAYPLRVIARNAAGMQTVEVVPFRIEGRDTGS